MSLYTIARVSEILELSMLENDIRLVHICFVFFVLWNINVLNWPQNEN